MTVRYSAPKERPLTERKWVSTASFRRERVSSGEAELEKGRTRLERVNFPYESSNTFFFLTKMTKKENFSPHEKKQHFARPTKYVE